MNDLINCLFII